MLFLPYLPMLPTQILLNNFLYDLAQVTIPTDNVDEALVSRPQRWNVGLIRNFMLVIGPVSSLYDFVTFGVLLGVFHASEAVFHTGWFVESLATQTLVLFVIRTSGNPLQSRPSAPLAITTILMVAGGLALPYSPLARPLGFVPLPASYSVASADTQTQTVKKKKKTTQSPTVKKNYQATPPGEPNQAGMTDDCSYWYNVYGRMPVGCDKYGRSFRL